FHDHACDPPSGRFFTEFAEQTSQLLFVVLIYNRRGGEACSRVHAHVERAVSNKAETAGRGFELARGNGEIKKRAADTANPELVENKVSVPEIRLAHDDTPPEMRKTLAYVPDCIRVLV